MSARKWQRMIAAIDASDYEIGRRLSCPRSTITALRTGKTREPRHALGEKIIAEYEKARRR